jgi:micrococcal nuclease
VWGWALLLAGTLALSGAVATAQESRFVARVVDGDTIELDGRERVRLIGVDAPEHGAQDSADAAFADQATAFVVRLASGQRVRLEFEPDRRYDAYGRTLAYVFLADGALLNLEIVRAGYAHAYTRFPFERLDQFRAAEREARAERRGLWRLGAAAPAAPSSSRGGCVPRGQCCRVCTGSRACGDACITASATCRSGEGCACDASDVCR